MTRIGFRLCFLATTMALAVACSSNETASPVAQPPGDGGLETDADGADAADAVAEPTPAVVDYLIVAADPLADGAKRFRDYRQSTGHQVGFTLMSEIAGGETEASAVVELIRQHIGSYYADRDPNKPLFVLLIGDSSSNATVDSSQIPAGSYYDSVDKEYVTSDNVFADMDGDHIPDLALGRLPVSTNADVDTVRAKVEAYESNYEVGPWNRRVNVFASTANFGEPLDSQIEQLAFQIAESITYDYDMSMTYASQPSPYVYIPELFSDKVYQRINEGSLMVSYIGHGFIGGFAYMNWSGGLYFILNPSELDKLDITHKVPILSFIACSTGAFTETLDSVSEQILKDAAGSHTVLSSTEVSHPLINGVFIYEFGQVVTHLQAATVGEAFMTSKYRVINNDDELREAIDALASALVDPADIPALEISHLHMYTLFGDPALKIAYPRHQVTLSATPMAVAPGGSLAITASLGDLAAGQATITLETLRSTILGTIQPVPADDDPDRDAIIAANYQAANDKVVLSQTITHGAGSLSTTMTLPAKLPAADYYVKLYADDGVRDAFGSLKITVAP